MTLLLIHVVEIHYAFSYSQVTHLLRLVLELDHVDRDCVFYVHVSSLRNIEKICIFTTRFAIEPFARRDCYIFHHHVNSGIQISFSIATEIIIIQAAKLFLYIQELVCLCPHEILRGVKFALIALFPCI